MAQARQPAPAALRNVLVPSDFSRGAGYALRRALRLPLAEGARVHLLHVLPEGLSAKQRAGQARIAREALAHAWASVAAQCRRLPRLETSDEVLDGEAFVEIIRCARRQQSDLIVLGRHGAGGFKDMLIGTTAERVVRKGDLPVLVVRQRPTRPYQVPLIATDLGDASLRTLDLARSVLGPEVGCAEVLHVFNVPFEGLVAPASGARSAADYRKSFQEKAAAKLRAWLRSYRSEGIEWRPRLRDGDPRSVIAVEARKLHADLLVLGTHGRAGLSHVLLGSVAEFALAAALCDVLVARPVRFTFELP